MLFSKFLAEQCKTKDVRHVRLRATTRATYFLSQPIEIIDTCDTCDTCDLKTVHVQEKKQVLRIEYSNGQLQDPRPVYKRVGAYRDEEHLLQELADYPRLTPCPKMDWHWQDKERCYQLCKGGVKPLECVYHDVALYEVQA